MTCAVMMELVQGEGGVLPLDQEFVKQVEALCREKDMLLIIDEVQTGIGRTGSLFCVPAVRHPSGCCHHGARVSAAACRSALCSRQIPAASVLTPGTHATTFGGTPLVVCAAANAVLDHVGDPKFLHEVKEKGEYLKNGILVASARTASMAFAAWV